MRNSFALLASDGQFLFISFIGLHASLAKIARWPFLVLQICGVAGRQLCAGSTAFLVR